MPGKMTGIFTGAIIIIAAVILAAFYYLNFVRVNPNRVYKQAQIAVGKATFNVDVASTTAERLQGLSGREGLAPNQGMYFIFDSPGDYGFWMKDMKFPIDIVWVYQDKVVGFSENLQPEPGKYLWQLQVYYPPESVDKVLEIAAGAVAADGLRVGDSVTYSPY